MEHRDSLGNRLRRRLRRLPARVPLGEVQPVLRRLPQPRGLVARPAQHLRALPRVPPRPRAGRVVPLRDVLQAGRALEGDGVAARVRAAVAQRGDVALRVDGAVGLVLGGDDGDDVRAGELAGEDERLDVVDVGGAVGWRGGGQERVTGRRLRFTFDDVDDQTAFARDVALHDGAVCFDATAHGTIVRRVETHDLIFCLH